MKKEIYRLFTLENGIIMTMPVLSYLSECIRDCESLGNFFASFKAKFNTSTIDFGQIEQILSHDPEERDSYIVKTFRYVQKDLSKDFERFRSQISGKITPISLLEVGVESLIFGIFYRDKCGMLVLEDDHEVVGLCFDSVSNNVFVFEGMFVGVRGTKRELFDVSEIVLPTFTANSSQNSFLDRSKMKICVFGCGENQTEFIKSILDVERPNIAVVSANRAIDLDSFGESGAKTVVFSCRCDESFLPSQTQGVSNPFMIELFDTKISFIDYDLFRARQEGVFLSTSPVNSFLKSLLSQSSINPFAKSDMSIPEFPNVYVVSQSACPLVLDVDGIKFVSLPSTSKGAYAVLDFQNDRFEVVYK